MCISNDGGKDGHEINNEKVQEIVFSYWKFYEAIKKV